MLYRERYRVRDGKTPLNGEQLNGRLFHIDTRIHALEELTVSWEAAVAIVQAQGLERINAVIQPVLDGANAIMADVRVELDSLQAERAEFPAWWDEQEGTLSDLESRAADLETSLAGAMAAMATTAGDNTFSGDNDFTGTNNFTGPVTVPTPTVHGQAVNKGYVDSTVLERPFSVGTWAPDPDYPPENDEKGYGVLFPGDAEARMTSILSDLDTGKDFSFELHVVPVDTSAGNVKFSLDYRVTSDADNLDSEAWTNLGSVTLALAATAYQKNSGTFSGSLAAASIAAGDLVQLRLTRNPDDAADTAGGAVAVKLRVIPATPE